MYLRHFLKTFYFTLVATYFCLSQVEYLLRKLSEAMGMGWSEEKFSDYKLHQNTKSSLTVWGLVELVGLIYFSKDVDRQTLSMSINEVFSELILDILKQVSRDVDLASWFT